MHGPATTSRTATLHCKHPSCDKTQQHKAHSMPHTAPPVHPTGPAQPDLVRRRRRRVREIARERRRQEATAPRNHWQKCEQAIQRPTAPAVPALLPPAGHRRPAARPALPPERAARPSTRQSARKPREDGTSSRAGLTRDGPTRQLPFTGGTCRSRPIVISALWCVNYSCKYAWP